MDEFAPQPRRKFSPWLILLAVVAAVLAIGCSWLYGLWNEQKEANAELTELAELDKQEMEDQYRQFDMQYGELQRQIRTLQTPRRINARPNLKANRLRINLQQINRRLLRQLL